MPAQSALKIEGKLHQSLSSELGSASVGSSTWASHVWIFEQTTAGRRRSAAEIRWKMRLLDETDDYESEYLTDPRFSALLDACKRFVYSLMHDPRGRGSQLKATSLEHIEHTLRFFLRWMVAEGYESFSDIPVGVINSSYIEYLVAYKAAEDDEDALTDGALSRYTALVVRLYEQHDAMPSGVHLLETAPFDGQAGIAVAKKLARKVTQKIPAVPTRVFVPIMAEAIIWAESKSWDVINIHQLHWDNRASTGHVGRTSRFSILRKRLLSYNFSCLPGQNEPWRKRFELWKDDDGSRRSGASLEDGEETKIHVMQQLRHLVLDARDAAVCLIQGLVGMRISEVAGLKGEPFDHQIGMPICVEIEETPNGLYEAYFIRGRTYKGEVTWQETRWAAGLRPKGSTYIPPVIRALQAMYWLFKPYRDTSGRNDLILGFSNNQGLPTSEESISPIMYDRLLYGQKAWISRNCSAYSDINITTHMWRKTYALQLYMSNPDLLPAISMHFNHLNTELTFKSYVRDADPDLTRIVEDVATAETAELLLKIRHGEVQASGRMVEALLDGTRLFGSYFTDVDEEGQKDAIDSELHNSNIRAHECGWGRCIYRPEWARCNGGRTAPSEVNRSPGICSGCNNLLVLIEHKAFWQKRLETNLRLVKEARESSNQDAAVVPADRVEQCRFILAIFDGTASQ